MPKKTILVIYHSRGIYPIRDSIRTHLYCWQRYSNHRVAYLNVAMGFPADIIRRLNPDVILFHTLFLGMRWGRDIFRRFVDRCRMLADLDCIKIAMPQDEFLNTDLLNEFINEFGVTHLLTMAGKKDCSVIYDRVDFGRVRVEQVLAGYVDPRTVERIDRKKRSGRLARDIDVGYRAWNAAYWLGQHALHKVAVAHAFQRAASRLGLRCDISLRDSDTLSGDSWFDFLLRCRATIGAEGGATVLDRNGEIKRSVEEYLRARPKAGFEEVRERCFQGQDGRVGLTVITPRHFEACATETLQFLVEGNYNGILEPWRHYIPIKADYSNVAHALSLLEDQALVERIRSNAYREIVASEKWTYPTFVQNIERSIVEPGRAAAPNAGKVRALAALVMLRILDFFCWQFIRFERWMLDGAFRRTLALRAYNMLVKPSGRF